MLVFHLLKNAYTHKLDSTGCSEKRMILTAKNDSACNVMRSDLQSLLPQNIHN